MAIGAFPDERALLEMARSMVRRHACELRTAVAHWLRKSLSCKACGSDVDLGRHVDFPALLHCFATIDLLGALYAGDARSRDTTKKAAKYMREVMRYTDEQIELLQGQCRHKLVHLAQPQMVVHHGGRCIAWEYARGRTRRHLQVYPKRTRPYHGIGYLGTSWEADHAFCVSIKMLANEIADSAVVGADSYLGRLEQESDLQARFGRAAAQLRDTDRLDDRRSGRRVTP
jgi:hypothetical protein